MGRHETFDTTTSFPTLNILTGAHKVEACASAEAHPDAVLLDLVGRFERATHVRQAAIDALDALHESIAASEPARPAAMRRTADFRHFWGAASNPDSPEFYTGLEVRRLRSTRPSGHLHQRDSDAASARAAEIGAAYDEWQAACAAHDAAHGLPEAEARWDAVNETCQELQREIRATAPRTLAGLAALARFAQRFQAEDDEREGGLLARAILAVAAHQIEPEAETLPSAVMPADWMGVFHRRAEQQEALATPATGLAGTAGPSASAFPLTDQIVACWREWAAQPDGDESEEGEARYERLAWQRDSLLDATEAMPATLENVPAKALASAWLGYVATWSNGQLREDYGTDGRLGPVVT